MELQIGGRAALVTGASSGIGRGIARGLAAEGARVAIHGRRRPMLEELAAEIEAAGGYRPVIIEQDVTAEGAAAAIAAAAEDALGPVEILVNNAGGARPLGPEATEDAWAEAMTVNFTSHRRLSALLAPKMSAAGWGRIVNITGKHESAKGVEGAHTAKAAMHAWSKGMSRDLGRSGITVNCIAPGKINSDQILRRYPAELRAREAALDIPVGRYGEPSDIANLVCFLASPAAAYITGTVIPVDGGLRRYQY